MGGDEQAEVAVFDFVPGGAVFADLAAVGMADVVAARAVAQHARDFEPGDAAVHAVGDAGEAGADDVVDVFADGAGIDSRDMPRGTKT